MTWDAQYTREQLIDAAWRAGELRWLLQDHQLECYDKYREWEQMPAVGQSGAFKRVFVLDIGKRWGKTSLRLITRVEDCLRNPGRHYRYTTAKDKAIEEIVGDIMPWLLATCPDDIKPRYQQAKRDKDGPKPAGYYFANGSSLRLAGLDMHPDALRGRACDGDDISEAGFVKKLKYTIKNVLYHQYQRRPWARMCLESSAPMEPDTEYDTVFVDEAKHRNAYYYATIDDNTAISDEEREEFIVAAGGREHDDCKREYFNIRVRPKDSTVVPEFDLMRHVKQSVPPPYRLCFTTGDPGVEPDPAAMIWGYWDHLRYKLVLQRSWHKLNCGTTELAGVVREGEEACFKGVTMWNEDTKCLEPAPHRRWSDIDKRLIIDLRLDHDLQFMPTPKPIDTEVGSLRAGLFKVRDAFLSDQIELWPGPQNQQLADELHKGRWDERRKDFQRTPELGHLDCLMCLVYTWRNIQKNLNPNPPAQHDQRWFERPVHKPTASELLRPDWRRAR